SNALSRIRMFWPFMDYCSMAKGRKAPLAFLPLLGDRDHDAGADGLAALADGEALLLLHRDRRDQLHVHRRVVARHDHLAALRQGALPGHVSGAEVELRAIIVEERRVPAALLFREDIGLGLELLVRLDRAGLA